MACISMPTAMALSGALGLGGSIFQGLSAESAGGKMERTAMQGATMEQQLFDELKGEYQPYISGGTSAFNNLLDMIGAGPGGNPLTAPLTAKFNPTMDQLSQTPGYKFALQQGQLATQSGYAAQGLGQSGAAMKGAANYAEGLASTTYQQQFQNYLAQNSQIFNMLAGPSQLGASALGSLGSLGSSFMSGITGLMTGGASAGAAGTMGLANSLAGGASGLGNNALLMALLGGGGGGAGSASMTSSFSPYLSNASADSLFNYMPGMYGSGSGGAGAMPNYYIPSI